MLARLAHVLLDGVGRYGGGVVVEGVHVFHALLIVLEQCAHVLIFIFGFFALDACLKEAGVPLLRPAHALDLDGVPAAGEAGEAEDLFVEAFELFGP